MAASGAPPVIAAHRQLLLEELEREPSYHRLIDMLDEVYRDARKEGLRRSLVRMIRAYLETESGK